MEEIGLCVCVCVCVCLCLYEEYSHQKKIGIYFANHQLQHEMPDSQVGSFADNWHSYFFLSFFILFIFLIG